MTSLTERNEIKRYKEHKKKIKQMKRILIIGTVLMCVCLVVINIFYQINRTYKGYKVIKSTERSDSNSVRYISYGENFLKYSKDGATGFRANGEILWSGSYEMKNPLAVTCDSFAAVADIGGRDVYIYNGSDTGTYMKMDSPIEQISVARQGVFAVVLKKNGEANINIYDPYNVAEQLKVSISTSTDNDGFPVAIALSKDGQKLVTSYINVQKGVLESSLNFYNFDSVGKNSVDRIVGSRPLEQQVVVDIDFLTNNTICAYTKDGFQLYYMQETPRDVAVIEIKNSIKSVSRNSKYIAVLTEETDNVEVPYKLHVYDTKGKEILQKEITYMYDSVEMGDKEVILYSNREAHIIRLNGKEKFNCQLASSASYFFAITGTDKYLLIDGDSLKQIRLTGKEVQD
ncbi:MAG: hypothetical protein HFJ09_03030 [Lachnospiraceae bacterium]|nr:hypothetical protein [Lachnospiraceae bacterium]